MWSVLEWFVLAWFAPEFRFRCPESAHLRLLPGWRFRFGLRFLLHCPCCLLRRPNYLLRRCYQHLRIALKQPFQTFPCSFSLTLDREGCSLLHSDPLPW